jgi:hypothetical protein
VKLPEVSFHHVFRLSDDTGLFEHGRGCIPRREHGYCVDDVARGLLVVSRETEPGPQLVGLADRYLAFVAHAQVAGGTCHNRLGYNREWEDGAAAGDWWGRSLWGLGSVASGSGPQWQRAEALDRFELGAQARSVWPRAVAFAALGAAEVNSVDSDNPSAHDLLERALHLGRPGSDDDWPWPQERLSYANAAWAEALIAAGHALGDGQALADGLRMLSWLVDIQTYDDHLSMVPVAGWSRDDQTRGFDQQPIEVAALADACTRAFAVTQDVRWRTFVVRCLSWFLGNNDSGAVMYDPATGGGYDGLERGGVNRNQGAESTLAWLMVLQRARKLHIEDPVGLQVGDG